MRRSPPPPLASEAASNDSAEAAIAPSAVSDDLSSGIDELICRVVAPSAPSNASGATGDCSRGCHPPLTAACAASASSSASSASTSLLLLLLLLPTRARRLRRGAVPRLVHRFHAGWLASGHLLRVLRIVLGPRPRAAICTLVALAAYALPSALAAAVHHAAVGAKDLRRLHAETFWLGGARASAIGPGPLLTVAHLRNVRRVEPRRPLVTAAPLVRAAAASTDRLGRLTSA